MVREKLRLLEEVVASASSSSGAAVASSSGSGNGKRCGGVLMARSGLAHVIKHTQDKGLVYEQVKDR